LSLQVYPIWIWQPSSPNFVAMNQPLSLIRKNQRNCLHTIVTIDEAWFPFLHQPPFIVSSKENNISIPQIWDTNDNITSIQ
jgi:hypothetical protein